MLVRFEPFRPTLRTPVTPKATNGVNGNNNPKNIGMPMDAYRRGGDFVMHFDLPGVDPASIDITVDKNTLSITAERSWKLEEDDKLVAGERFQGTFSRQLYLGETLDQDKIQAAFDNGVLTLTIPVSEAAKPKKIEITAGS